METTKKTRTIQRASFTKCLNSLKDKCVDANVSYSERLVALQLLELKLMQLEEANTKYTELLIASDTAEDVIEEDVETHENYKLEFLRAKLLINPVPENPGSTGGNGSGVQVHKDKPFRPTLEIPKFSGGVDKWLHFWSHFRKIHDDMNITKEDKLTYLKQSMEKGSRASRILYT